MSCGVGCRRGSYPELLWLWRKPAAGAPIRPLAWELPYTAGVVLKSKNKKPPTQTKKTTYFTILRTFKLRLDHYLPHHSCKYSKASLHTKCTKWPDEMLSGLQVWVGPGENCSSPAHCCSKHTDTLTQSAVFAPKPVYVCCTLMHKPMK